MNIDFVGIGVTKAGTTWTWQQLVKHPEICDTGRKEAHLFHPQPREIAKCGPKKIWGEYTPMYLSSQKYRNKILKKAGPDVKILVTLRNPIDRAVSQFKARQWSSFRKIKQDIKWWFHNTTMHQNPKATGIYADYLPMWEEKFPYIHVSLYDDMIEDQVLYIQRIYDFLGVNNSFVPPNWEEKEQKAYNKYFELNPYHVSKKDRAVLVNFFRPSIMQLAEHLHRPLGHWLE